MVHWMCGEIISEMDTLEGQQWCKRPRKLQKMTQLVQPCDEAKRGAHSEKNARCGRTTVPGKRRRRPILTWKDA